MQRYANKKEQTINRSHLVKIYSEMVNIIVQNSHTMGEICIAIASIRNKNNIFF